MTQEEQYLLTFVPQITADTDPLQEEIDSRLKDYEDKWAQLNDVIKADDELQEVPQPDESKKPGCGVPVVVRSHFLFYFLSSVCHSGLH